ncbi:MAG: nuclear transport factor 2 family protein [Deltaproteobacteria bacterium]|nr:nuclear transport factor 2 family protein [Deltaproteobacteria bacterium]MBW2214797.1 nuclear transport factor 2 family protein [Deltaproteobacteria bacterium]MBW2379845.1 nuclear transport factor 2 family protein [Deltaproteobacteria bacterium]MBW2628087.1 nuclear transport factor 2 family protein [Deltaproteobacteria bacterium]MBW2687352.1 nuclear transport factor 2 family protein [Deltaproteobacteria bacterium]
MSNSTVDAWHKLVDEWDMSGLDDLLADDAVFHSPVVHTPQRGKQLVKLYLNAAAMTLYDSNFTYVREVVGESDAFLEFTAELQGIHINAVDIIHWNADGKIDDFKVMIRPLKAVNLLHGMMKQMLGQMGPGASATNA